MRDSEPIINLSKPHVVVFGRDADGRTRAGRFLPLEAEMAKAAAASMKFNFAAVTTPELVGVATHLKHGVIYRRGPSFVSAVKRALYDRLVSIVGTDITAFQPAEKRPVIVNGPPRTAPQELSSSDDEAVKALKANPTLPKSWDEIREGDLVIAQANPKDGWWEAIVIATNGEDLLIKWRDYSKFRQLRRSRFAVALLHPQQSKAK